MTKRPIQLLCRTFAVLTLIGARHTASADQGSIQSLDAVKHAATAYLQTQAGAAGMHSSFDASALDPRLRLAGCPVALEAFSQPSANGNAARITVGVRCNAGPRWTVYVPVIVSSDIKLLVLRQFVQRGSHITASDVSSEERHLSGLPSTAITSLDALTGKHVRSSLPAGTALTADMFASDAMIKRGQQVTLYASVGGIEVRAAGEALSEAGSSGRVRVRNLSSMRVVEGVAETGDRVRVSP